MIQFPGVFDCQGVTDNQTDSCILRLSDGQGNFGAGGNFVYGHVSGQGSGASPSRFAHGMIVSQNNNHIDAVRGYYRYSVRLELGVEKTYINMGGKHNGGADQPAVLDNSGTDSNTIFDHVTREFLYPEGSAITMWDTGGIKRTLAQPTGAGPATWV